MTLNLQDINLHVHFTKEINQENDVSHTLLKVILMLAP